MALTDAPRWRPRRRLNNANLPRELRSWLCEEGSLTRRLRDECNQPFGLKLVSQRWERPLPDERGVLRLATRQAALVRQVCLLCGDRTVIFARSVFPKHTLEGAPGRLAHLGTRPLADILFADGNVLRGEMEFALLTPGTRLFRLAAQALGTEHEAFWGRRSLFRIARKRLLVSEVFLPDLVHEPS